MRLWVALVAGVALLSLGACGGGESASDEATPARTTPTHEDLGNVSSVVELRDALVKAGYECPNWQQDNKVKLAAESGTCDDASVLSTFASEGDRQAQLDTFSAMDELFADADVEQDPILVGPNWMFRAPGADTFASALGGTVVGPPG